MIDPSPARERPVNMWEELNKPKPRQESVEEAPEEAGGGARLPIGGIVGAVAAAAAVVVAGFIMLSGGPVAEPDAASPAPGGNLPLVDEAIDGEDGSDATTPDAPTEDTSEAAVADGEIEEMGGESQPSASEAEVADEAYSPAIPAGADDDYVVLSRGKLYLRGEMPSQLFVTGVVSALEELMGEGNVISEYEINPEAEFVMGGPADVYIEDTVLFAFASAEIAPDFYPLLGLGVTLMNMQEGVTIEVYGHTDSSGSDQTNLELSQARVDAVKAFFLAQGIEADRITAIGRGETEPVADNATAEGRQLNRRVEIVINGFVFAL